MALTDLSTVPKITAPLTLTLFGSMQVQVGDGPLPHLRSRKALWLLALLALRPGRPVEREWLAGTLWPDIDQERAFDNLRPILSELRKALGDQGVRLQSPSRDTLLLDLNGADVDVVAFDQAIARGTPDTLRQAAALHRGPLLEGCAEEWVGQERDARDQDCRRALISLAEAALAAGDHRSAVEYFQQAVALDPWSDSVRRGLMEALMQSGNRNAALQVYREFTVLLRSDPTAIPAEETQALYVRLRTEARRQASASLDTPSAPVSLEHIVSGFLPSPITEMVGREEAHRDVAARLRRSRLVTLTGPGGIGKTRLAIAAASDSAVEYRDGVWFISLEELPVGTPVAGQVAGGLMLKEEAGRDPMARLIDYLRARHLLLVLDNCEHVLESASQVTEHLLRDCAGVRVLATSREVLGIIGETVWAVPALSLPDLAQIPKITPEDAAQPHPLLSYEGIQLFVERAQAVKKDFALTPGNALAVAQVCARLEGIPLAIELAAARVLSLTVEQIAARLDDHLRLLTGSSHRARSRQHTLRVTLDWSYALLSVQEQLLLGRLSVFAGGWSLEAAEAVCGRDGIEARQILDLLTVLVNKSLVMFEETETKKNRGRYRLLETVRQYAAERLRAAGREERFRRRHRDFFRILAEEAEPQLHMDEEEVRRLEADAANLRAAMAWSEAEAPALEDGLRLAGALWPFWSLRGEYSEGSLALRRALERDGGSRLTAARAKALYGAGTLAYGQAGYIAAQPFYEESLSIRRQIGDRRGIAESLSGLGKVAHDRGDYEAARTLYEESLDLHRQLKDTRSVAWSLSSLGNVVHPQGDFVAAARLFEESLGLFREMGERRGIAWALSSLGNVAYDRGESALAQSLYEESLIIRRDLGDKPDIAWSLSTLGNVAHGEGNFGSAGTLFEESLNLFRELGERRGIAWSLRCLGDVTYAQGHLATARKSYEESLGIRRELGDRRGIAWSLNGLSKVLLGQKDFVAARVLLEESLSHFLPLGDKRGVAKSLEGLAAVMLALTAPERAARLWGAAQSLRESISAPLPPRERGDNDYWMEQIRSALGEDAFRAACEEGGALSWEQAIVYALEKAPAETRITVSSHGQFSATE